MTRRLAVLGSTGSVGSQALDVLREHPEEKVYALSDAHNLSLLRQQIKEFAPERVVVKDAAAAGELQKEYPALDIGYGPEALAELAADPRIDLLLSAVVGVAGLPPLLGALKNGTTVALANKEPLVAAGELIIACAEQHGAMLIPVDSEHSAIFQCLQGDNDIRRGTQHNSLKEIILTASGGPFFRRSLAELAEVTPEEAARHPRWKMGSKISIDSATLINKGLEMIEARWLFALRPEQIRVVIHPESIVHSLVSFADGAVLAQLGLPDMRLPISYALSWPKRWPNSFPVLDWSQKISLHFEPPDEERFVALRLAREAMLAGGTLPAVFNAANEAAVELFRAGGIRFDAIVPLVERVMQGHKIEQLRDLATVEAVSTWAEHELHRLGSGADWRK